MYEHLRDYASRDQYPFHMPGHKQNPDFLPGCLPSLDLTEINGMDDLHAPDGIILETQRCIAAFYGADESFLLVNGSSAGILAAICACCGDGDSITVGRNAHKSVFNGLVLSGAVPHYISPAFTADGLSGGILPEEIPPCGVTLITSPTYEGFVSDVEAIAKRVHRLGGILIVDEAHGAHFPFHPVFPKNALESGADIVVNSFHKTLPAFSQSAVLHVKGSRVDRDRLRYYLQAVQTSSPSYIFMATIDHMMSILQKQPALMENYAARLSRLRGLLPGFLPSGGQIDAAIRLSGFERRGMDGIVDIDAGKLLFACHTNVSAVEIAGTMDSQFRIQMEMARGRHILGMTSVADTDEGFERLFRAVKALNDVLPVIPVKPSRKSCWPIPDRVISPRQAARRKTTAMALSEALGRISGGFVMPYPPGIPLAAPGERITADVWEAAVEWGMSACFIKVIE